MPETAVMLSLVIPTYNERDSFPFLLSRLIETLDRCLPHAYEIIVVDDDSPDQTWAIATDFAKKYSQLRVLRRQQEHGLASAVVRGWQVARGEILGVIDADGQHPPEAIANLLRTWPDGVDVAIASRYASGGRIAGWRWDRRLLSRGAQALGWLMLPEIVGGVSDPMSGCFLVRRGAIAGCCLSPLSYKVLLEVLARGRVSRISEAGYEFCARREGISKVSWRQYRDYLLHLGKLRWDLWRVGG